MGSIVPGLDPAEREFVIHSFVVRIWLEEIAGKHGQTVWRGHVTHVPSNARCYFENLAVLPVFVASYLRDSGVQFNWAWRLKLWICKRKLEHSGRFFGG